MMAAEQWYEYQNDYKRYGIDMKPRTRRKQDMKVNKASTLITPKDKFRLLIFTFLIGILCIGLILATAYAANVKTGTNTLIKENAVIQGEIENLTVELEKGVNIQVVESRAIAELGMIYPNHDQLIFLKENKVASTDFILAMKEMAYN